MFVDFREVYFYFCSWWTGIIFLEKTCVVSDLDCNAWVIIWISWQILRLYDITTKHFLHICFTISNNNELQFYFSMKVQVTTHSLPQFSLDFKVILQEANFVLKRKIFYGSIFSYTNFEFQNIILWRNH